MQRRPKILNVQKERLVSLVQNYFVRSVGSYENVGPTVIPMETWIAFASDLNSIGTFKTAFEWKQSFTYMKSRVRTKAAMVMQCGADPKDNLSETDQAIYAMYPLADRAADLEKEPNDDTQIEEFSDTGDLQGSVALSDTVDPDNITNGKQSTSRGRGRMRGRGQVRGRSQIRGSGQMQGFGERSQVTQIQKERLLQLLENNFFKAFGRYSGANGAAIKKSVWESFADELNALGPYRTSMQWKSMFDYIKGSAKTKLADMRKNRNQRGVILTRMEERVVALCGLDNMDGEQELGEGGFRYEETVQHQPKRKRYDSDSGDEEELGIQMFFSDRGRCREEDYFNAEDHNLQGTETISLNDTQDTTVALEHNRNYRSNGFIVDTQLLKRNAVEGPVNSRRENKNATVTSGLYELCALQNRTEELESTGQLNSDYYMGEEDYVMQPGSSDNLGSPEHNYAHKDNASSIHPDFSFVSSSPNRPSTLISEISQDVSNSDDIGFECDQYLTDDHIITTDECQKNGFRDQEAGRISHVPGQLHGVGSSINSGARGGRNGPADARSHSRPHEPGQSNGVQSSTDFGARGGRNGPADARSHSRPHEPGPSNGVQSSTDSGARGGRNGQADARSHSRPHEPGQSNGIQSSTDSGARGGRGGQVSIRTGRDRERHRNRFTSYDMVERSINAQERFIEQSNRNHSENIFMFTSALNACTKVLEEYLKKDRHGNS